MKSVSTWTVLPELLSDGTTEVGSHVLLCYDTVKYPAHIVANHDMEQIQHQVIDCYVDCIVSDLAQMEPPEEGVVSCPRCRYGEWKEISESVYNVLFKKLLIMLNNYPKF